jgi:SPP1 family predicted phage head-tail adaptor
MEGGRLRYRITIQQAVATLNSFGDAVLSWSEFATRWASVEPLSGRELWQAQQVAADVTHRVSLRRLDGVTPKMRVLFGARVLNIIFVRNVESRSIGLELLCQEEV